MLVSRKMIVGWHVVEGWLLVNSKMVIAMDDWLLRVHVVAVGDVMAIW